MNHVNSLYTYNDLNFQIIKEEALASWSLLSSTHLQKATIVTATVLDVSSSHQQDHRPACLNFSVENIIFSFVLFRFLSLFHNIRKNYINKYWKGQ